MLIAINNIEKFFELSAMEVKVLILLLHLNDDEKGEVFLPKEVKQDLANQLKVKIQSIYNTLKSLKDKGIIEGRIDYCRISREVIEKVELVEQKV